MGFLNREALLTKQELQIAQVDLGKGDFVFVREMTGRGRDQFEQSLLEEITDAKGNVTYKRRLDDFRAKLAVNTVCTQDGIAVFEPGDYATLSKNIGASRLERIVNKAQEINGITEKDKDAMVKNSEGGQTGEVTSV